MQIKIGITDTKTHYENYPAWIKRNETDIEIIHLKPENIDDLEKCDGIVLSGGIDTHPKFYRNPRINYRLAPKEFNTARDEFELHVFNFAQKKNIPVLAVCRGMQLVNVALGGDLIQDIEESGKLNHRSHEGIDGMHKITISKDSLLFEISGKEIESVNSAHHQALNKIAADLKITAFSPDGIPEAAEWKNKGNKPFLLCVQWHPERLAKQPGGNSFSHTIRRQFLNAVNKKLNSKP